MYNWSRFRFRMADSDSGGFIKSQTVVAALAGAIMFILGWLFNIVIVTQLQHSNKLEVLLERLAVLEARYESLVRELEN